MGSQSIQNDREVLIEYLQRIHEIAKPLSGYSDRKTDAFIRQLLCQVAREGLWKMGVVPWSDERSLQTRAAEPSPQTIKQDQ